MKKIVTILMMVCFFTTMIFAQTTEPATKNQVKKTATDVKAVKPAAKAVNAQDTKAVQKDSKAVKPEVKTGTAKLKKDGTPDMRLKENKDAAKAPTGPLKKDGTPDKRFKENKKVVTPTK